MFLNYYQIFRINCEIVFYDKPNKLTNYEYFKMFNCKDEGVYIKHSSSFQIIRNIKKYTKNNHRLPDDIIDHIKSYNFGYSNMHGFVDLLNNYRSSK